LITGIILSLTEASAAAGVKTAALTGFYLFCYSKLYSRFFPV